jgi:hypothetical protein
LEIAAGQLAEMVGDETSKGTTGQISFGGFSCSFVSFLPDVYLK